ncbi:hypothetical protein [Fodinibius salsisoli]|uniref:Outer membrane protein beta-barrel domain-containing protein n=1 Tax=Fodinibius salsisoli TaxID=2820877 RepID=A0ABT3PMF8_9BACT|nr:hypothetical protein [Fodinibius salsisoli]MCW9707133.1 hypothetical protein [Fodinibius salsisoli]
MTIPNQYLPLLLLLLILTTVPAHAQTEVSIKAGAHYSNIIFKDASGDGQDTQFKPGWQVGIAVDIPLGRALLYTYNPIYSMPGKALHMMTAGLPVPVMTLKYLLTI